MMTIDPEIFFINKYVFTKSFLNTICEPQYLYSEKEVDKLHERISEQLETIINHAGDGNDYKKILAIHDILCANIKYTDDCVWDRHTAVGAFIDRKAVCDGYAKAFKMIMDKMGYKCLIVLGTGIAPNDSCDSSHAWNLVQIDSEWRHVDIAYDARDNWKSAPIRDYFSLTDEQIKKDHKFDSDIYPEASGAENDYYTQHGLVMEGKKELRELTLSNIKRGITTFSVRMPDAIPDSIAETRISEVLMSLSLGNEKKYTIDIECNSAQHIYRIKFKTSNS